MGRRKTTKKHTQKIISQKAVENVALNNHTIITDSDNLSKESEPKETTTLKSCENQNELNSETKHKDLEKESSDTKCVINIYSRLTYPLVHSSMKDRSEDSDDEDAVVINFCPRFVFASNLCLICMETSKVVCEHCAMVSYCSVKHKQQGWQKHRDLCKVLTNVCSVEGAMSMAKEFSSENYRIYRLKLIEIIERGVGRSLELWEKEIILYPRVCRACHEFSNHLKCCSACNFDLFCERHESSHVMWCQDFQVFRRILFLQHKHGSVDPYVPNVLYKTALSLPENLDLLMAQHYAQSCYYSKMDCHTYSTLSHISTVPLTTLYSLQTSCSDWKTLRECTIHVIGAEFQFECINLHVWEKFFLHFLPSLKKLSLVFVGPELQLPATVPSELLAKVKLCSNCKTTDKLVNVSFEAGKCYHEYTKSKHFSRVDLLCLFNPGLYRDTAFNGKDTWPASIRELCKLRVPIVVTSYTEHEIPREVMRIKSIFDVDVILEPQKNPFSSIKPDRNFVSDDTAPLIYKNYYITIVRGK